MRTKAATTVKEYGLNYFLIGGKTCKTCENEIEESASAPALIAKSMDILKKEGVNIFYGKWLIEGTPSIILFDLDSCRTQYENLRKDLKEHGGIPIEGEDQETIDGVIFGHLVNKFMSLVWTLYYTLLVL